MFILSSFLCSRAVQLKSRSEIRWAAPWSFSSTSTPELQTCSPSFTASASAAQRTGRAKYEGLIPSDMAWSQTDYLESMKLSEVCFVTVSSRSTEMARWRIRTALCMKSEGTSVSVRGCTVSSALTFAWLSAHWADEGTWCYVMICANARETGAVHLRLSEQMKAYDTHICALTGELTERTFKLVLSV